MIPYITAACLELPLLKKVSDENLCQAVDFLDCALIVETCAFSDLAVPFGGIRKELCVCVLSHVCSDVFAHICVLSCVSVSACALIICALTCVLL